ncbi:hypothetical protein CMO89_04120 [Candidatus Woesearchaeota archaeon]|nr:hypothetical protein [Candidatus Woesearchaeota archaeon]|tara:strand:- start:13290 stop:13808 length:519 start_codon:yes stop_codon:yes gene_type:complete
MAVKANLIVTHEPSHIGTAKKEVEALMKALKHEAKFLKSDIDGLFNLRVKDPRGTVKKLNKLAKKQIELFDTTFHWTPIDKWCKSTVKDMQKTVKVLVKDIKNTDKWKMELNKRKTKQHERDLIIKLTSVIDKPNVDLNNPKKIVRVEIVGNKAGFSLLGADELLNVAKMKK